MSIGILPSPIPKAQAWAFAVMESALLLTLVLTSLAVLPRSLEVAMHCVYLGTAIILMVASPFFLRSLRMIALLGWALGFGCFLRYAWSL